MVSLDSLNVFDKTGDLAEVGKKITATAATMIIRQQAKYGILSSNTILNVLSSRGIIQT